MAGEPFGIRPDPSELRYAQEKEGGSDEERGRIEQVEQQDHEQDRLRTRLSSRYVGQGRDRQRQGCRHHTD